MAQNEYHTATNLIELIEALKQGESISRSEIKRRYQIQDATAGDYICFLKKHLPLQSKRKGKEKIFFLCSNHPAQPSSINRVFAIEHASQSLILFSSTTLHQQLTTLAMQERQHLCSDQQDHIDRLLSQFHRRMRYQPDYTRQAPHLDLLIEIIRKRKQCQFYYRTLEGTAKLYQVEPWAITQYQDVLYLLCRKSKDGTPRTFEIAALEQLQLINEPARIHDRGTFCFEQWFRGVFGIYSHYGQPQSIQIQATRAARQRLLRYPHPLQTNGDCHGDWQNFSFQLAICPEFQTFLIGLLPDIRIVAPESLKADILRKLEENSRVLSEP